MPSPSPSNGSTTSSTSLVSEGRKSTTSGGNAQGAKKFGKSNFIFIIHRNDQCIKIDFNVMRLAKIFISRLAYILLSFLG